MKWGLLQEPLQAQAKIPAWVSPSVADHFAVYNRSQMYGAG
jgi:hypothetical protein